MVAHHKETRTNLKRAWIRSWVTVIPVFVCEYSPMVNYIVNYVEIFCFFEYYKKNIFTSK
jgi:hypothetical protein